MDRPRPARAHGTRCDPRRKTRPSRDPLLWRPARPARADRPAHRMARHLWRVSSRGAYRTRPRRRPFAADVIAALDTPEQFFDETCGLTGELSLTSRAGLVLIYTARARHPSSPEGC